MRKYSQHTQAEDALHRVTVADKVAPVSPVLGQPPLALLLTNGSVIDRQVFHHRFSPNMLLLLFQSARSLFFPSPPSQFYRMQAVVFHTGSTGTAAVQPLIQHLPHTASNICAGSLSLSQQDFWLLHRPNWQQVSLTSNLSDLLLNAFLVLCRRHTCAHILNVGLCVSQEMIIFCNRK